MKINSTEKLIIFKKSHYRANWEGIVIGGMRGSVCGFNRKKTHE